jgi:hypothetical protein
VRLVKVLGMELFKKLVLSHKLRKESASGLKSGMAPESLLDDSFNDAIESRLVSVAGIVPLSSLTIRFTY